MSDTPESAPLHIAARGSWGTVEWAINSQNRMPAQEFYTALPTADRAKVLALFQRLAEFGSISNREKFKNLGREGGGLSEFKSFQIRFLGDFRPGKRFIVAHGLHKKKDRLDPSAIETAKRILAEHDKRGVP